MLVSQMADRMRAAAVAKGADDDMDSLIDWAFINFGPRISYQALSVEQEQLAKRIWTRNPVAPVISFELPCASDDSARVFEPASEWLLQETVRKTAALETRHRNVSLQATVSRDCVKLRQTTLEHREF